MFKKSISDQLAELIKKQLAQKQAEEKKYETKRERTNKGSN